MKQKPVPLPKSVKLVGNIRIRKENMDKTKRRVENAVFANKVKAQQMANHYQAELQRLDAAVHRYPANLQRQAILMNRGHLQRQYEKYKIA